jgi:hypothetical protein
VREPTAAGQIWPHLRQGTPEPVEQQQRNESVASAMWPSRNAQPKSPQHSDRDSLLRGLKELNAKIDARLRGRR